MNLPQGPKPKLEYAEGDPCWIWVTSGGISEWSGGRVIAVVQPRHLPYALYVIEMDDSDFLHHETRDATLMSPEKERQPPFVVNRVATPTGVPLPPVLDDDEEWNGDMVGEDD